MSPKTQYILAGTVGVAITKFYFHRTWLTAIIVGLSVISTVAIISAKPATT